MTSQSMRRLIYLAGDGFSSYTDITHIKREIQEDCKSHNLSLLITVVYPIPTLLYSHEAFARERVAVVTLHDEKDAETLLHKEPKKYKAIPADATETSGKPVTLQLKDGAFVEFLSKDFGLDVTGSTSTTATIQPLTYQLPFIDHLEKHQLISKTQNDKNPKRETSRDESMAGRDEAKDHRKDEKDQKRNHVLDQRIDEQTGFGATYLEETKSQTRSNPGGPEKERGFKREVGEKEMTNSQSAERYPSHDPEENVFSETSHLEQSKSRTRSITRRDEEKYPTTSESAERFPSHTSGNTPSSMSREYATTDEEHNGEKPISSGAREKSFPATGHSSFPSKDTAREVARHRAVPSPNEAGLLIKNVPVACIKAKHVMKLGLVETITKKYKAVIEPLPSKDSPNNFKIQCYDSNDLRMAEKRLMEALESGEDEHDKVIVMTFKPSTIEALKNVKDFLSEMERQEDSMVFDMSEDDSVIQLMGHTEQCILQLTKKFGDQLELPEWVLELEAEANRNDDSAEMEESVAIIKCEAPLYQYLLLIGSDFMKNIFDTYNIGLKHNQIEGAGVIQISGQDREAAQQSVKKWMREQQMQLKIAEIPHMPPVRFKQDPGLLSRLQKFDDKAYVYFDEDSDKIMIMAEGPERCTKVKSEVEKALVSHISKHKDQTLDSEAPAIPSRETKPGSKVVVSEAGHSIVTFRCNKTKVLVHVFVYDITKLKVDVIVNAANESLMHGGGVAAAIQRAAGWTLENECKEIVKYGRLRVTELAKTSGGNLQCRKVFHAVGPSMGDYYGDERRCFKDVDRTVKNCLDEACKGGFKSIAIPAISSGIFGVKPEDVARIMASAIARHLEEGGTTLEDILLVDIIPRTVQLLQEAIKAQETFSKLETFRAMELCATDPVMYRPPGVPGHVGGAGYYTGGRGGSRGAWQGRSGGSGGPGYHARGGYGGPTGGEKRGTGGVLDGYVFVESGEGSSGPGGPGYHSRGGARGEYGAPGGSSRGEVGANKKGKQPLDGEISVYKDTSRLPGYGDCGTITIFYSFPSGKQANDGPHPGQWYDRDSRSAYLPDNKQGKHVLKMLEKAFRKGETFAIGINEQTRREGIIWNGIDHKTSIYPGSYGYPDDKYLDRVVKQLRERGITG